jgi:diguanylate cyclase (GGDEF)-like protein
MKKRGYFTTSEPVDPDFFARYGGEEFVALLPDTGASGAMQMAEQLRAAVAEANIPHEYSDTAPMVTISIGVAMHSQETPKSNMEELLMAADLALYQAKEKGRNRVQAELPRKEDNVNG